MVNTYICHHGIKGMHWGVRRYQNPDGSLTNVGRKRLYKTISKGTYKDLQDAKNKNKEAIVTSLSDKEKTKLKEARDYFVNNTPTSEQLKAEDKAYEKASSIAYDKTYKYFKKNNPKYLSEIENLAKKDKPMDLTEYHDFRKTFEGFEDEEWKKIKPLPKSKNEDKAYEEYNQTIKSVSKNIIGKYGDKKVTNIKESSYFVNNTEDFVRYTLFDIMISDIPNNWKTKNG